MDVKGVFHCFSGSKEEAERIVERGMYVGIGGVITYKANQAIREVLKEIDRSRVLLETDSPYLAPIPHRGKRNESAYIQYVADTLAECWGITALEVAQITSANAHKLFPL
jgi:TatD DNase family protein